MVLKILGSGCKNCEQLYENAREAVRTSCPDAEVIKVTDMMQIAKYGVMRTPALIIDEKVAVSGRVPSAAEIVKLIQR